MINCKYIEVNEMTTFLKVANEKYGNNKIILNLIKRRVLTEYSTYLKQFETFETKVNSAFSTDLQEVRDALQHCYSSETASFIDVRGRIFNEQPSTLQSICPFCMIGDPITLDHFIGQTEFPEFSILARNLIPCCDYCQRKKGERWRQNKKRRFIHFYNDQFLHHTFLKARIYLIHNVPNVIFRLDKPSEMTDDQFQIVQWHFSDLNLLEKYGKKYNSFITTEIDVLKDAKKNGHSLDIMKAGLISRCNSLTRSHGANYYETVLFKAMAGQIKLINRII